MILKNNQHNLFLKRKSKQEIYKQLSKQEKKNKYLYL